MRGALKDASRLVIKVGSSLVTNQQRGLEHAALARWASQIAALKSLGKEVLLVSSGAIAEGMQRLNWNKRPHTMHELQAAAAVGQMGLIQAYETCFREFGLHTAQILLTHEDLSDRKRYLNARSTLRALLGLNVIPIINENDTVVTDEIRFGDNDTLGALVTNLIEADVLIILTDLTGLYTADPRKNPHAKLVEEARAGDEAALRAVAALDHPATHQAVRAERALLRRLGGGCAVPIAAYAEPQAEWLAMLGVVSSPDGGRLIRARRSGAASDPEGLGLRLAEDLLRQGAGEILEFK